jgi:CheY-like chemotaxis protein
MNNIPPQRLDSKIATHRVEIEDSRDRDADDPAMASPVLFQTCTGLRVLLAEDQVVQQKIAVRMLESTGHSVVVAPDGRQAIATLATGRFDVILMDVQMSEMDGFEAVRSIRQREAPTSQHIPILALTAHAMQGDRDRCLQAGFDGYLAKPIRQNDLKAALEVLQLRVSETHPPTRPKRRSRRRSAARRGPKTAHEIERSSALRIGDRLHSRCDLVYIGAVGQHVSHIGTPTAPQPSGSRIESPKGAARCQ